MNAIADHQTLKRSETKKPNRPINGSPAISKPNQLKSAAEKTRDFPSQSYDWFGFLIILIFVRKIRVSNFLCRFLKIRGIYLHISVFKAFINNAVNR